MTTTQTILVTHVSSVLRNMSLTPLSLMNNDITFMRFRKQTVFDINNIVDVGMYDSNTYIVPMETSKLF